MTTVENENRSEKISHGELRGEFHLHSFLKPLLLILVLLFVLSSGLLGYILGRNAGSSGELIDTIVLSPGNTVSQGNINHYLTGKVVYPDGSPCTLASVQLDEDSTDKTDEQGKFFFVGLQSGEYFLTVTDESGSIAASTRLLLDFSKGQTATADFTIPGEAELLMPENTRMLDMTLVVEENALTVQEGSSYLVTTDGEIVDFVGGKLNVSSESLAVTPTGSVVTPDGYVLLLSRETVLTPTGGNEAVNVEAQLVPEVEVREDGSAVTGEGVLITADDNIVTPDGETSTPDEGVVVVEGETVEKIDELPQDSTTTTENDAEDDAAEEVSSAESSEVADDPASGENSTEESSAVESSVAESAEATEPKAEDDKLSLVDIDSGTEWAQMSLINLFKNSMKTEVVDGVEYQLIAPGSSGTYEFRLINENDFDIEYTIAIAEETLDLPIGYSVFDKATNYCYMNKAKPAITTDRQIAACTATITLEANSQRDYRIDWFWDHEARYKKDATNKLETEIAMAEDPADRLYTISLKVNASQVIYSGEDEGDVLEDDEDRRYPGVR